MSAADKAKLDGIAAGAEVNQNAFTNVKVGTTTISADSKTDTLELVAGTGITLTPDSTNDKVTISVSGSVAPSAHAATHKTGGSDPLSPADIGAETPAGAQAKVDSHANKTLGAHKASAITIDDVNNHFSSTNVEGALEELFQSGVDGKAKLETAIIAKNGTVSKQGQIATFDELDAGIRSIRTSNVKSIQRGRVIIPSGGGVPSGGGGYYTDIYISSVDKTKSIVLLTFVSDNTQASNLLVQGSLLTPTSVRFTYYSSPTNPIVVDWQVIEFDNVKSLQTGTLRSTTTLSYGQINPVKLSKSILFFSYCLNSQLTDTHYALITGYFYSNTQLAFERKSAHVADIAWQVVEFD
jgi:hypothetical protein